MAANLYPTGQVRYTATPAVEIPQVRDIHANAYIKPPKPANSNHPPPANDNRPPKGHRPRRLRRLGRGRYALLAFVLGTQVPDPEEYIRGLFFNFYSTGDPFNGPVRSGNEAGVTFNGALYEGHLIQKHTPTNPNTVWVNKGYVPPVKEVENPFGGTSNMAFYGPPVVSETAFQEEWGKLYDLPPKTNGTATYPYVEPLYENIPQIVDIPFQPTEMPELLPVGVPYNVPRPRWSDPVIRTPSTRNMPLAPVRGNGLPSVVPPIGHVTDPVGEGEVTLTGPKPRRPSGRRTKERKLNAKAGLVRLFADVVRLHRYLWDGIAVIDAIYDALPKQYRKGGGAQGKLEAIWAHYDQVDLGEAIDNIAYNFLLEDKVVGYFERKAHLRAIELGRTIYSVEQFQFAPPSGITF